MKKSKSCILASFVAVMLCFTAFSTVALANGNDPEAKPETTASTEQAEVSGFADRKSTRLNSSHL